MLRNISLMLRSVAVLCLAAAWSANLVADERCVLTPMPNHQVAFEIEGKEITRWHFGRQYPRPFLFPIKGPVGGRLTRMGHPGAPNHDHHRSVWLAHHSVNGRDFWSDNTGNRIRQKTWFAYRDGPDELIMAVQLGWFDQDETELMEQDVVVAAIPFKDGQYSLEIQITMRPTKENGTVELGKTNFGFLAVRVAKTISAYFGGGKLSNSEGDSGEPAVFGKRSRWVDYSGPVAIGQATAREVVIQGITYFDHPANPRHPTHWHVRDDGWMGASFNMHEPFTITSGQTLRLRYLLYIHVGGYDDRGAAEMHAAFAKRPAFEITKSSKPHHQYTVKRE